MPIRPAGKRGRIPYVSAVPRACGRATQERGGRRRRRSDRRSDGRYQCGAATVWHNQQQLEAEARLLHQQAQRLTKQSAQWVQSYQDFHQALKALGDVENWAKSIESDMAFIHSSLDALHHGSPDGRT